MKWRSAGISVAVVLTMACGPRARPCPETPPPVAPPPTAYLCPQVGPAALYSTLPYISFAKPRPDFVELRVGGRSTASRGWRCRTASSWQSCEHELATLPTPEPSQPWNPRASHGPSLHLVYERQGHFAVAGSEAEVLALLGPIDALEKVLLLTKFHGYVFPCEGSEERYSGRFRAQERPDGGWVLTASDDPDPARANLLTLHVSRNGIFRVERIEKLLN